MNKLTIGSFSPSGYPKIRFDDGDSIAEEDEWFVATAYKRNQWLNCGWDSPPLIDCSNSLSPNYDDFNLDHKPDYHPGEDWNTNLGGSTDKKKEVYSIAKGKVLFKSGPCNKNNDVKSSGCNNTEGKNKYKGGYGNTVILLHKTISGEYITSFYGHLMDYDCPDNILDKDCNGDNSDRNYQKFNEGDTVDIDTPIGKVGTTGTAGYHLHFEIRNKNMIKNEVEEDGTETIKLAYKAEMWPSSMVKKDENNSWVKVNCLKDVRCDNGYSFINENYYDPSYFIKNYLNQYDSSGNTLIKEGVSISDNSVVFKGIINDPSSNSNVKLQIELRRIDEYNGTFTGDPTHGSSYVASGSIATIAVQDLINGNYHWRARVVNEQGTATEWVEFGTTGNTDFIVQKALPARGIVFQSNRDGNNEIYTMNIDGSNQTRLTNNPANESSPSWSPDGQKIVFISDRDGNYEIYVMNADGTNLIRLTNNLADDFEPYWSPDGTKIVFRSYRDGNAEIYMMNSDGTNQINISKNGAIDGEAKWSPDGTKMVFASWRNGAADIWVMNSDGTNPVQLTFGLWASNPAWSPDGTKIAFVYQGNISVMNADGTNQTTILSVGCCISPYVGSWSPDGTKIAIYSDLFDGNFEIYTINSDGTNRTRLTNNTAADMSPSWK